MQISGEASIQAPRDRVWWALNDPSVLVRTIPGCLRLEETAPDAYRMTVTAGVAAIKGTYDGEVRLSSQQEPESFVLAASGAGAPGTVSADVRVHLEQRGEDATHVSYDADATVGGVLGGVGQRMIAGVARKTADEFFRNVEDVLTGRVPATAVADAGASTAARRLAGQPRDAIEQAIRSAGDTGAAAPGLRTFEAPAATSRAGALAGGFAGGAVVGALSALAGVVVGWLLGRRAAT